MAIKKKKQVETEAKIPPINIKMATLTIVGDSPLLINAFAEKSIREMEDKQTGKAKQKKAARNILEEYKNAFYYMDTKKKKFGIPASGIKLCAVSACRYTDLKMTNIKGTFHVLSEANGLCEIKAGKPVMDESIVRIGGFGKKIPMTRYRPRWDSWEITFKIRYNANIITPAQIANLYENAGFGIGLCEHRPEKNGSNGMFHVKRAA